jgi:hypothetical protein
MQDMGQEEVNQNQEQVAPEQVQQQPAEKMIPVSQVNEIVKSRMAAAANKAREEMSQSNQSQGMGGMQSVNEDQIRRMIDEAAEKRSNEHMAHRIATNFVSKLEPGRAKYSDFDSVIGDLDLANNPHIVALTEGIDNTSDVLYEMGVNPSKFSAVVNLAVRNPHLAARELRKISESIKTNEQAASYPKANEPLSELKSSTVGVDNGKMSVRDLRKMPWLRG